LGSKLRVYLLLFIISVVGSGISLYLANRPANEEQVAKVISERLAVTLDNMDDDAGTLPGLFVFSH
jgi:hypothetical protein